jgi:Skp family chaperone for outer membrane proteins
MKIYRRVCRLLAAALLTAAAGLPARADGPTTPAGSTAPAPLRSKSGRELSAEFVRIIRNFDLQGPAREVFLDAVDAWEKDIDALNASQDHADMEALGRRLQKARDANDKAKVAELEPAHQQAADKYWARRAKARAKVLAALTPEQQQKLAVMTLWERVGGAFKHVALTSGQVDRVQALCAAEVAAHLRDHPAFVSEDPYFKGLNDRRDIVIDRARLEVLDDGQREKVAPRGSAATQGGAAKTAISPTSAPAGLE